MNSAQTYPATSPASRSTKWWARQMLNKVPEITAYFWVIKMLCTTVGETFADNLNENLGLGLTNTSYIMGALLIAVLVFQFRARSYIPGIYWLAVVLISVVGTLVSDNLVENSGSPWKRRRSASALPDRGLRHLVRDRAHALGPHHRHHPARGLLLAGDPLHLRPRHLGGRPALREARTRLPADGRDLRRRDRRRRHPPLRPEAERDPLLLARLHPHPPARRLDRRLPRLADRRRRPRPRHHLTSVIFLSHDPGPGRLPGDLQARRDPLGPLRPPRLAATGPAVLVVLNKVAATAALLEAVRGARPRRRRASTCSSRTPTTSASTARRRAADGEELLAHALPPAARGGRQARSRAGLPTAPMPTTTSSKSSTRGATRDHPRDAAGPPLHWLHVDLPRRIARVGLSDRSDRRCGLDPVRAALTQVS